MARSPVLAFSSSTPPSGQDDIYDIEPDGSFSSDASSAPLLSRGDGYSEKEGLPFSRSDLKADSLAQEEKRDGRWRHVKAVAMVVITVLLSSALFTGSYYLPKRAARPVGAILEEGLSVAPLLTTQSTNGSLATRPKDYNPLFPDRPLEYDRNVFIENLRRTVAVNTPSSVIFHCRHPDISLCASAYRVLFVGPTISSPLYRESRVLDERRVEVEFELQEPGSFEVFAWPEHETCDQWNHGEGIPYHKLAVVGTPARLDVEGAAPADSPAPCTLDHDLTNGRWISKDFIDPRHHSPSSPYYNWLESHYVRRPVKGLTDYSSYGYVWAPYNCKPRHHSFDEWLDLVKPERLVVMGDSVMRDLFCQMYESDQEVCKYEQFGEYEQSDKHIAHTRHDGSLSHLHFHWEPLGDPARLEAFLTSLDTPPSHIFFNVMLWLTRENPDAEVYAQRMRPFLETLVRVAPEAKIVARTSAGAVQAIACYDLWRIQRRILEPANAALLSLLQDFPTIRPLDVYPIYNDRPEASQDGRHWQRLSASENERPEEGAVGYAVTDLIFEGWRLQV
ncbi:hypothetical protein JCM6882_009232 [Rhodosporidiobolus microsporus]